MSRFFHPNNSTRSKTHKTIFVWSEFLYTLVDFLAAALFVIGSALFFSEVTTYVATWCFLIGSVFFGLKPTIKLVREVMYARADADREQAS